MRIRKNATKLTVLEKNALVDALKKLKAKSVLAPDGSNLNRYDNYVALHLGVTYLIENGTRLPGGAQNGGHNNAAFLAWHREFLRRVEEELRTESCDDNFTIPYWDWTDSNGTMNEIFVNSFMGGDGTGVDEGPGKKVDSNHPFSPVNGWPIDPRVHIYRLTLNLQWGDTLRRSIGTVSDLPESSQIDALFESEYDNYEDFRAALEQGPEMHNAMHAWVGGSMVDHSSPNDPIFMLNHANIDRLWALWQAYGHYGESHYPDKDEPKGHKRGDLMWPWHGGNTDIQTRQDIWKLVPRTTEEARPANVLDCRTLEYGYVDWIRVKEILDNIVNRWRDVNLKLPPQTITNDEILAFHSPDFGWTTKAKLAKSTAFGVRLIEPKKVGNGRGFETNLVTVLKGKSRVAPQMPLGGPHLSKIEIAEIAHWIDSGDARVNDKIDLL